MGTVMTSLELRHNFYVELNHNKMIHEIRVTGLIGSQEVRELQDVCVS